MLCASHKIRARFAALLTPKWLLLGIYQFVSTPDEDATLALLEALRQEAYSDKPAVPPAAAAAAAGGA